MKKSKDSQLEENSDDSVVIRALTNYYNEATTAARDRQNQNLENFDTYHLKQDFTYKKKGQSKEFLAKQFMAVEQITSFVQQGLADLGSQWYSLELENGQGAKISRDTIKLLLDRQLKKADIYTAVGDALKCGLLGSLMIAKVHGCWAAAPRYVAKEVKASDGGSGFELHQTKDKVWQLAIDIVSTKDFYPDPTGRGLYTLEDIEMDMHDIRAQVKSAENPRGIYDAEAVKLLSGDLNDTVKQALAARESGQNVTMSSYRHRVKVQECWGNIIDEDGNVIHENVVCAVAMGKYLIRRPQKNPLWHQKNPYVVAPIVRVPHSVWHKALMDGPTKLNRALNEIFNLQLDSGIMAVYGVKQLRTSWLADASLVDDGIAPGQTLEVTENCPPGQKVLERVDTASMSPEAMQVYNMTNAEFQQNSMTNDLRMGVLPSRQVKATEVVESSQSITGMLNGVAKAIEDTFIQPILEKSWMTVAQHIKDFDKPEVRKLLGSAVAGQLSSLSNPEIFAETVNGLTFEVFGITSVLNKQKDFRRITAFLQTIASSPILVDAFSKKYSFDALITEILKSLDINEKKLKLEPELGAPQAPSSPNPQAPQPLPGQFPGQAAAGPNAQSQIPQVASEASGSISSPKFPASPVSNLGRQG